MVSKLTNFATQKIIEETFGIDKLTKEDAAPAKRERLMKTREKAKLEKLLGGISNYETSSCFVVVDVKREHIVIAEAQKLNIPVFALVIQTQTYQR